MLLINIVKKIMRGKVKRISTIKEILNKLNSKGFLASSLSTHDFSTLYTILPRNLIKEILTGVIKHTLFGL